MANYDLSTIFSSPARTKVLEILVKLKAPLHLRRIAELSDYTIHAIDKILKDLHKERLVAKRKKGQYILYSPNNENPEIDLVREVVDIKEVFLSKEKKVRLSKSAAFVLKFTDDLHKTKWKKSPKISSSSILVSLVRALSKRDIQFILVGDFPAAIYRKEPRVIKHIEIEVHSLKEAERALSKFKSEMNQLLSVKRKRLSGKTELFFFPKKESDTSLSVRICEVSHLPSRLNEASVENEKITFPSLEEVIVERGKAYLKTPSELLLLDDLQNILLSNESIDLPYLISKLLESEVPLHAVAISDSLPLLKRVSKEIIRAHGPFPQMATIE